jgi:hypothetical protein
VTLDVAQQLAGHREHVGLGVDRQFGELPAQLGDRRPQDRARPLDVAGGQFLVGDDQILQRPVMEPTGVHVSKMPRADESFARSAGRLMRAHLRRPQP